MNHTRISILCLLCFVAPICSAGDAVRRVRIGIFDVAPVIDGDPSEEIWSHGGLFTGFVQVEPTEGAKPSQRTEVRIGYDPDTIYIALYCWDDAPEQIVATEVQRDARLDPDDRVEIILDTFHDRRNAYFFQIGPAGSRGDALVAKNGNSFNKQWDTIWEGKSTITAKGWFAELAIPVRSISFDPEISVWGINIERKIKRLDEDDRWASPSQDTSVFRISTAGEMEGLEGLRQGVGIDFKPYAKGSWHDDREDSRQFMDGDFGADLSWKVTPNLTWTVTANTDFAETEVDERQVNLSRFPLFFPEKREFFLEDAGIFDFGPGGFHRGGGRSLIPFFSRRIGLDDDGGEVPILAGNKLTGRIGDYNIGVLDVQTQATRDLDSKNLLVSRISKNIWDESTMGVLLTRGDPTEAGQNAVAGFDLNYSTSELGAEQGGEGKSLRASGFVLASESSAAGGDGMAYGGNLSYPNDLWRWSLDMLAIGKEFNPALGFVRRHGVRSYTGSLAYRPRPGNWIRQYTFSLRPNYTTTVGNETDTWSVVVTPLEVELETGDRFEIGLIPQFETFDEPFEIHDGIVVPGDDYGTLRYSAQIRSSDRRPLSGRLRVSAGGFLSGHRRSLSSSVTWRPGVRLATSLEYQRQDVELDEGDFTVHIVGGRFDVNISPELTWDNFLQWDNESEMVGLNSRLRFIPSDGRELYLVYNKAWWHEDGSFVPDGEEVTLKIEYVMRF